MGDALQAYMRRQGWTSRQVRGTTVWEGPSNVIIMMPSAATAATVMQIVACIEEDE